MRLRSVAFRYHRRAPWVLRDLAFELPAGRITEVTGGNGTGKSTLLGIAAGILRPRRGRVTERPERIGYAPERFPSAQPFTVTAYLHRLAAMRGMGPLSADIEHWADRLGLTPMMDVPLPELSKGSAQKVGLVQALIGDPALLVLDEPFAGLDARTRAALPLILDELAGGGAIILVSDHQQCLAELPDVTRLRVDGGRAIPLDPLEPPTAPEAGGAGQVAGTDAVTGDEAVGDREAVEVLEVLVHRSEADALAGRLRAEGHRVRRRGR